MFPIRSRKHTTQSQAGSATSSTSGRIDLGVMGVGVVAAHGFSTGTRGVVSAESVIKHKVFAWLRKFVGAVALAAAIGAGLMIYTYFSEKWRQSGLPMIPIDALVTHNQQGDSPAQPRASPHQQQPTGGLLIDNWDG